MIPFRAVASEVNQGGAASVLPDFLKYSLILPENIFLSILPKPPAIYIMYEVHFAFKCKISVIGFQALNF